MKRSWAIIKVPAPPPPSIRGLCILNDLLVDQALKKENARLQGQLSEKEEKEKSNGELPVDAQRKGDRLKHEVLKLTISPLYAHIHISRGTI